MKVPQPEEEIPLAWRAILADTPVFSRDDREVGVVAEVLGSDSADIFHGIVVTGAQIGHDVAIGARDVIRITNVRIDTSLSTQEIRELPVYVEEDSYKLGFVGLLGRHLGWVRDEGGGAPG